MGELLKKYKKNAYKTFTTKGVNKGDSTVHNDAVRELLYTKRDDLTSNLNTIKDGLDSFIKSKNKQKTKVTYNSNATKDINSSILSYDSIYKKVRFSVLRERVYFGAVSILLIVFILFFNYKINKKNESLLSILKKGQFRFNTDIEKVNKKLSDVGEKAKEVGEKAKEAIKKPSA